MQQGQPQQIEPEGRSAISRVGSGLRLLAKGVWTALSVLILVLGFVLSGGGRVLRGLAGLRFGRKKDE